MIKLDPTIFKEYDIRGRVPDQLNEERVLLLAKGFASFFLHYKKKKVGLSYDNRLSSESFKNIIAGQLAEAGLNVIDFGLTSTGMNYFSLFKHDCDAGIMITASHLGRDFNGFKISLNKKTIFGKQIQEIRRLIEEKDFLWLESGSSHKGKFSQFNILPEYVSFIKNNVKLVRPLKVVVDCGNGTASLVAVSLFSSLGCMVIPLYCKSNGNYPNHEAYPAIHENLAELIDAVLREKADLGIAFDGDADRLGAVDNKGNILPGDIMLILFSRQILSSNSGGKVVFDVKCSNAVSEEVKRLRGTPLMWKTGHSLIKEKLGEENALVAGEMSGHFFFNDKWFGFDDGIYAACRLLELLSNSKKTLFDLVKTIPHYHNTPEIRVSIPEQEKFDFIEEIKTEFLKEFNGTTIDGIRVEFPDGWALIRASNTSSKLIIRFEADSKEHLERIKSIVRDKLLELKPGLKLDF